MVVGPGPYRSFSRYGPVPFRTWSDCAGTPNIGPVGSVCVRP